MADERTDTGQLRLRKLLAELNGIAEERRERRWWWRERRREVWLKRLLLLVLIILALAENDAAESLAAQLIGVW